MLATVAAPWLLLATILVPPGSQTVWLDGTVGRQGWEQTARSPAEGWLLAELSSAGTVDLDLAVSDPAAGWRRSAASHQAREWLLVRVDAGAALRVRVGGPDAEGRSSGWG